MNPQSGRWRCQRHGLVVSSDGACPSCARSSGRSGARIAGVVVALATIFAALWWWPTRHQPEKTSYEEVKSANRADDPVRLSADNDPRPAVRAAALAAPSEESPRDFRTGAEDLHVGEPPLLTGTLATVPPGPPRASMDPEPAPSDDPRDFELPAR